VAGRLRSDRMMYFPPRLASRAGWEDHDSELPVIEGTLIRLS
jgi:hypothetical protein